MDMKNVSCFDGDDEEDWTSRFLDEDECFGHSSWIMIIINGINNFDYTNLIDNQQTIWSVMCQKNNLSGALA